MAGMKMKTNKKTNKSNNNNKKQNGGNRKGETAFNGPKRTVKVQNELYNLNSHKASKSYRDALLEPFSDAAIGCRVPDQYFCPTVTYAVREFLSLKVDGNGSFDCVITPNPLFVAWSSRNSISNGSTLVTKDGGQYTFAQYINPPSGLFNKLSSYRIVSWGVRIRQTQSINVTQGTVTAALYVPKDGLMHPAAGATNGPIGGQNSTGFNAGTSLANYIQDAGLPNTAGGQIDIGSLVDFPYHMRASCVNAAENAYEISPKLCSPTAFHFRDSNDSLFGSDMTAQGSLVYVQPGDSSYLLTDGWTNIVVAGSGLVATSVGAVDIEIVYNIEGNPFISAGTGLGGTSIAVATGVKSVCDPIGALMAQAALDCQPGFKLLNLARVAFKSFGSPN